MRESKSLALSSRFLQLGQYLFHNQLIGNQLFKYLQDKEVWIFVLLLWDDRYTSSAFMNVVEECRNQCLSQLSLIQQQFTNISKDSALSLFDTIVCAFDETPIQSVFVGILLGEVFIHQIHNLLLSTERFFRVFRVILHLLPVNCFLTNQYNYSTLVYLSSFLLEGSKHTLFLRLIHLWMNEYERLTEDNVENDSTNHTPTTVERKVGFFKQILSPKWWVLILKSIEKNKENDDCLYQFILLLSELLRLFGVSTVINYL